MEKILSIIVPSYNMEHYLPKCLGSLIVDDPTLLQLLDVIVVNDGSKDRTSEIAHEFEAKYPGVFRVIDKANGNYGSCINAALPVAQGKYVKVLDADDWFDTREFRKYLVSLGRIEVDLVITDYSVISMHENGEAVERHDYSFPTDQIFSFDEFAACKSYVPMHTFTYATRCLREINYVQCEGVSYTDTEWITIPLCNIRTVRYLPLCVYSYLRGREGQTMNPEIREKSMWMHGKIALHMLAQYEELQKLTSVGPCNLEYVRKLILQTLEGVYRHAIVSKNLVSAKLDLYRYDDGLMRDFVEWAKKLDDAVYSKRLPYKYIRGWRSGSLPARIMLNVCRLYTRVLSRARDHE